MGLGQEVGLAWENEVDLELPVELGLEVTSAGPEASGVSRALLLSS